MSFMLGLTERRIRQLRDEGILKEAKFGSGLYEPCENVNRYITFLKAKEGAGDYYEERAGLIKAKREKAEYELRKMTGELHESTEVEYIVGEMLTRFKARMTSIPAKAAPFLAEETKSEKVYERLKRYINEALEELSDYDELFGRGETCAENGEAISEDTYKAEPAAGSDAQRMGGQIQDNEP